MTGTAPQIIKGCTEIAQSCPDGWTKFFAGMVTSAVGAFILRLLETFRVNRTEFNTSIDQCVQVVATLIDDGCQYWSHNHDPKDEVLVNLQQKIKTNALRVSRLMEDLYERSPKFKKSEAEYNAKNICICVTSGDFETAKRKADTSRCHHIREVGMNFEKFLRDSKIKKRLFN